MRLFTEENFTVIVSPEAKNVPGIRKIWTRDKDQRKPQAYRELCYLYYMNDYKSPYYSLPPERRHARLIEELKMPAGWKVDKELEAATKQYLELVLESESTRALAEIKAGLVDSTDVITTMRKEIQRINKGIRDSEGDGSSTEAAMLMAVDLVERLLKLSQQIPKAIATIKQLEEDVKKEQSMDLRIRGGGGRGDFED